MDLQDYLEYGSFTLSIYLGYSGLSWWSTGLIIFFVKALLSFVILDEVSRSLIFFSYSFLFAIVGWLAQGLIGWSIGNYFKGRLSGQRTLNKDRKSQKHAG